MTTISKISHADLERLIAVISENYSHDFSNYGKPIMERRLLSMMAEFQISSFDQLLLQAANDEEIFLEILQSLSINVTSLFREPEVFLYLRQHILPKLASYPNIRIWSAGTSTGEEAYSLSILLHETGLADRAQVYATDFNPIIVKRAARGYFPLRKMAEYSRNYQHAGGMHSLSRYYTTSQDKAWINKNIKDNILFSTHNLSTDGVFNEFQLILCRNVLIYFDSDGQKKKLQLFKNSLAMNGYLCMGSSESLKYSAISELKNNCFTDVSEDLKIYQCRPDLVHLQSKTELIKTESP